MNRFTIVSLLRLVAVIVVFVVAGCGEKPVSPGTEDHAAAEGEDFERGPHNGRLLRDGDFSVEITIFETGVPPEFRIYPYRDDQPVDPGTVDLTVELGRLGDRVDHFAFAPQGDYLRGDGIVLEPHSFDVRVMARSTGRDSSWQYDSYEGRTTIEPGVARAMGIAVEQASGATIRETISVQGSLEPAPDAVSEVRGRFPGIVLSLDKEVGDSVQAGERLASLQSNESLQTYVVTAPRSGTVVERSATVGSASGDQPLYVVADLSRLVADLKVFPRDLTRADVGQPVVVSSLDGTTAYRGEIGRILPTLDAASRAATVRIFIDAVPANWRPGQFLEGVITVGEVEVPLAVRESGLQAFRDFTVVYARVDDTYEVRMLNLGRRDGEYVEVLGGLEPGTTYVTENSYLVKADIEKSGASHDH
jgi:cobalt-zinc-cadmium efflux system membrane fusion protein